MRGNVTGDATVDTRTPEADTEMPETPASIS